MSSDQRWTTAPPTAAGDWTTTLPRVVAYNIGRGRRTRGWSQGELCRRLADATGRPWSPAVLSAAESGWAGRSGRVRAFDVEDVLAFALALELPLPWFFMPPVVTPDDRPISRDEACVATSRQEDHRLITADLLRWLAVSTHDSADPADVVGRRMRSEGVDSGSQGGQENAELEALRTQISDILNRSRGQQ